MKSTRQRGAQEMSGKRLLYLSLVLGVLLCNVATPLFQPSVAVAAPPDTPSNSLPSDNATGVSLTPTLVSDNFFDSDNDTHYASHWQISATLENYSAPVFKSDNDTVNLTSIAVPSGHLTYSTTYFWRVAYQDNSTEWSGWSPETSFTTMANQPPAKPINVSPTGTGIGLTPTLVSSAFSDDVWDSHAASRWQISTSLVAWEASLVFDSVTNDSSISIVVPSGELSYSTAYYWHVSYRDNNGLWSENSTETLFTTMTNQLPATPSNVSPNAQTVSVTPTLTSSAFNDPGDTHAASQWQIRAVTGTGSNYNNPVFDSGTDNTSLTNKIVPAATLGYSTIYWWHVRYLDNNGAWSAYSGETWFATSANQSPNQPVNSLPASGAPDQALTPTLQSLGFTDPDPGDTHAASQWQIAASSNHSTNPDGSYTTTVFDSGTDNVNLTSIIITSGRLGYSTTYYWHVRYEDNNLGWSTWSAETAFATVPNQPPSKPVNESPPANATVSLIPTLQSSPFSDDVWDTHTASRWQITTLLGDYNSPVFDSGPDNVNLTNIAIPSGKLAYFTTYYWHVSYRDNSGAWSGYSTETAFFTAPNNPPSQPTNVSPPDKATVSLTPTLESSAFSDDVGDTHVASQWQIFTVAGNYSSPVFDNVTYTPNPTSVVVASGLLSYSTTYYWRMRHRDDNLDWSEWSAETSFTTSTTPTPPGQPSNVSPVDAATGVSVTPTLQSSAFNDPDGGTHVASQWQITSTPQGYYSSPVFDSDVDAVHMTNLDIPSGLLGYSTTYYWRVRYQDNLGAWSAWSAGTSFTTLNREPNRPVNTLPADGATAVIQTPVLQSSAFSTTYAGDNHTASQWQISYIAGDYSAPVFDSDIDAEHLTSIAIPSGVLQYSHTYYWRVRYQDSHGGWSAWSVETSFATASKGFPVWAWILLGVSAVAFAGVSIYLVLYADTAKKSQA